MNNIVAFATKSSDKLTISKQFDLQGFLPCRFSVAAARVSRRLASRYGDETGISMPEWRVLAHLLEAGSVSVKDIHGRVDMDKPKVSRAATRLEDAGLVLKLEHVSSTCR